jgi:hypothetical protein
MRASERAARTALVLLAATLAGCATYSDRVQRSGLHATAGDYPRAIAELNSVLGVRSAGELPDRWGADRALAILERGILQQSAGRYRESARDLSAAEQELELLDLSLDPVAEIGRYVYSDSAGPYRLPASERLSLNAVNLLNYLALGDLEGAAVEARRFQVMREFLDSIDGGAAEPARFGAYLAGFVFERRGEGDRALRYYEEALDRGPLSSLMRPAERLAQVYPYRGPRLEALLAGGAPPQSVEPPDGELLVVLCLGRVPHKVPERIPVGLAVGIAGAYATQDADWLKYGAAKVLVYPELVTTPSTLGRPRVQLDGRELEIEQIADLEATVRREYDEMKPLILAAALSRLALRAGLAEGMRAAGEEESNLLGDLLAFFTEGLFVVLDRPDTRSWTMLPARVLVARAPISYGTHAVTVSFEGVAGGVRQVPIEIPPGGHAAVVITEPR